MFMTRALHLADILLVRNTIHNQPISSVKTMYELRDRYVIINRNINIYNKACQC